MLTSTDSIHDRIFYISMGFLRNSSHVFYNKHTSSTIAISCKAKTSEYEFWLYRILCSDGDGYFYGVFNSVNIDNLIVLFPELEKFDKSKELNPILFRYKVRI